MTDFNLPGLFRSLYRIACDRGAETRFTVTIAEDDKDEFIAAFSETRLCKEKSPIGRAAVPCYMVIADISPAIFVGIEASREIAANHMLIEVDSASVRL